jgi:uncharacterized protein (DUF2267 family)
MSDPIARNFNASLQKTYEWLEDVGQTLATGDHQTAYHALRGVLHALRDRLLPEEACNFAAELPGMLREIYFEGWSPAGKPVKMNRDDFLERVGSEISRVAGDLSPERCASAVFGVLRKRIAAGEITEVRGELPKQFQELWPIA